MTSIVGARTGLVTASLAVLALSACGGGGQTLAERTAAARAAQEEAAQKAREESLARIEAQRLAALWQYQQATVGGGRQRTAAILARDKVDVDGRGPTPVLLVFRDHQKWGRSSYLVLQGGDFACRPKCTVTVTVDDGPPEQFAAWRPNTNEAIAMFIRDSAALWRRAGDATQMTIAFPVKAGGTRTATFEVTGLDETQMPGW